MSEKQEPFNTQMAEQLKSLRGSMKTEDTLVAAREEIDELNRGVQTGEVPLAEAEARVSELEMSVKQAEQPETVVTEEGERSEKAYEKRLEVRDDWKEKKAAFEKQYRTYVAEKAERNVFQKIVSWVRKEERPEELVAAEEAYREARSTYAEKLDGALKERIKRQTPGDEMDAQWIRNGKREGLRAGLANRFVLRAAQDRLHIEKEVLHTDDFAWRTLQKTQEFFKKHRVGMRLTGYVTAVGIGAATGGLGAAVLALGSKTVTAKVAAGGAMGGAFLGGMLGDYLTGRAFKKQEESVHQARRSFDVANIDEMEETYLTRSRSTERAEQNKERIAAAGAFAGMAAGAAMTGQLDEETLASIGGGVEETPLYEGTHEEESVPVLKPETPVPETPMQAPEGDLSEFSFEAQEPVAAGVVESNEAVHVPTEDLSEFSFETQEPLAGTEHVSETSVETFAEPAMFTVAEGDTVSQMLLDNHMMDQEQMQEVIDRVYTMRDSDPDAYVALMEKMHISSGDIDLIYPEEDIDLQPLTELI